MSKVVSITVYGDGPGDAYGGIDVRCKAADCIKVPWGTPAQEVKRVPNRGKRIFTVPDDYEIRIVPKIAIKVPRAE